MARKKVALILGGGGARGAYQVGVLEAWKDVFSRGGSLEILIGVSAGSINAVGLMQHAPDYAEGVDAVKRLWSSITTDDIFESNFRAVGGNLLRLIRSSRHSGSREGSIANSMLDTGPLRAHLGRHIDMEQVRRRLRTLPDHALAVNCFDYSDKKNVTFFETAGSCPMWERPSGRGMRATLTLDHVMASCAAPILFPPVLIDGHYYGDGSLRNITPLQCAVRLGADRILNISLNGEAFQRDQPAAPTLGRIASTLFDGMFLDALDVDSQFLNRVNALTSRIPEKDRDTKVIDLCRIGPTLDFSLIAEHHRRRFPKALRYFFGGWITSDMLSYLLFDGEYTRELMEYGRKDGEAFRDVVEEWLG